MIETLAERPEVESPYTKMMDRNMVTGDRTLWNDDRNMVDSNIASTRASYFC
jgi:hypothetical protein